MKTFNLIWTSKLVDQPFSEVEAQTRDEAIEKVKATNEFKTVLSLSTTEGEDEEDGFIFDVEEVK